MMAPMGEDGGGQPGQPSVDPVASGGTRPAEFGTVEHYLALLAHSFEVEQQNKCPPPNRLAYLGASIFDFTTYDSDMDELFGTKAVEVCAAINYGKTFEYIADTEDYKWFLLMCNMPFFASRIEWGTSIRGAWWDHAQHELSSCGLWNEGRQVLDMSFTREEWRSFIAALIVFSTVPDSSDSVPLAANQMNKESVASPSPNAQEE